jgi:hypothetical protein
VPCSFVGRQNSTLPQQSRVPTDAICDAMTPDATRWCRMLSNGIPHTKPCHSALSSRTSLRMRAPRVTDRQQVTEVAKGCQHPRVRSPREGAGARAT